MKNQNVLALIVGVILLGYVSTAPAMLIGSQNNGIDYIFKGHDVRWLHAGVYMVDGTRDVIRLINSRTAVKTDLQTERMLAYVGISPLRWITVYGIAGENKCKLGWLPLGTTDVEYGGGLRLNLINQEIVEPVPYEDRWRVTIAAQYTVSSTDVGSLTAEWEETTVAALFGIVNDTDGGKYFTPESYVLYAGPVYSTLSGDTGPVIVQKFAEADDLGLVLGVEIFLTDSCSIDIEMQRLQRTSLSFGLNIHF